MKHMTETVSSVLGTPEEWTNPLRDPRDLRLPRIAGPCSIVIFGVTGDLSRKKLLPAIYDLANRGLLPPSFGLTGFARRDWTEDHFKDFVKENVQAHCRTPFKEATWKQLADGIRFVQGTFDDPKAFERLSNTVAELDRDRGTRGNHAFYMSVPPRAFPQVSRQLADCGLAKSDKGAWRRVIIEKPFGHDLASAKELDRVVSEVFDPSSVFRIDHYLGKETVQNILALRFANAMYEPIWNNNYVDHVQITHAEDIGVAGRAGYYDGIGAARDIIQNHLLQLMALTAMEEPVSFSASDLTAEKTKVLSAVRLPKDLAAHTARGQYAAGWQGSHAVSYTHLTGRSAIAYRVSYGIALTVTGPFGDPHEYAEDLTDFATFCAQHSWTPVFYSVHESQRAELAKAGWDSLDVGTEMIVNPNEWQTRGKKWQDVRTAINKAKRDGITDVLTTFKEAPFSVQTQIREISAQWAGKKALPEMGFTLGGVDELIDSRVRLLYAVDGNGKVLGVTSWLPTYRDGTIIGWTLDFMRHRTDSVNGIMEFLIARMAERLRDEDNVEFMSLSAAPLAGMGSSESEHEESEVLRHALQMVADIMEPAYGFHSLFRFKLKFHPDEEKVYICYPDAAKLPQISLAVAQAYVPSLTPAEAMRFVRTITPHD